MKLLIDMNLSPDWVGVFEQQGWQAIHWSAVGDPRATDQVIMEWARANGYVVFTHDLDFGALLASTRAEGPSVIQVRTQDTMPQSLGHRLGEILHQYESVLNSGALIVVDESKFRVRILPFQS
jgi:predicted nuclease of predicted toxin-antitoxin system